MKPDHIEVTLVTGAASGIGQATARLLHQRGAEVWAADLQLAPLLEEAEHLGAGYHPLELDVRRSEAWERALEALPDALDLLIHCAGLGGGGLLEAQSPERCQSILEVNLIGPLLGSRAALPKLRAAQGRLIFVGSMLGVYGIPGAAAYSSSKAGLHALAQALRLELEPQGIQVSELMPGFVDTPMLGPEVKDREKMLQPEELAEALLRARPGDQTIGRGARLMVYLARFWPSLLRWGLRRRLREEI